MAGAHLMAWFDHPCLYDLMGWIGKLDKYLYVYCTYMTKHLICMEV